MMHIKNIIFDLGGVILDIDYQKTENEFIKLGFSNFNEIYSQAKQNNFFNDFETGRLSNAEFIAFFKNKNLEISDQQILKSWNAMLLELSIEKLNQITELSKKYNLYLLSNTNAIHVNAFEAYIDKKFNLKRFKSLFKKVYYSNEIGLRKPNKDIFEFVINSNNINIEETLFIDDSPQHLIGAKQLGLHTYLHPQNNLLNLEKIGI